MSDDKQKQETRFWLSVMDFHSQVAAELNRALSAETGITLAKFDTMAQLHRFPEGLSMSRLSSALKVSNGNVSGLVNRLIKDGLVTKEMSSEDRRSFTARLTLQGTEAFERALTVHQEVLSQRLGGLDSNELSQTTALLRGLTADE